MEVNTSNYWLRIKSIDVWDSNNKIFSNLTLGFKYNENTIIIGPNGSGKSSLIKLINRSIYPVVKENSFIEILGSEKINIWHLRSKIGFVSNEIAGRIKPDELVIEIIKSSLFQSYSMINRPKVRSESNYRIIEIIDSMNLEEIKNRPFKILSDGQKRRVIIARALANDPDILILDEPTLGLDIKAKILLLKSLLKLKSEGKTIIHVTHDINSIDENINRVILLKNGKILGDGKPKDELTSKKLSDLFEIPLSVKNVDGYWNISPK